MTEERVDRGFRHATELVAGAGFSAVLTMATIVYLGRVLGPAEYADFSAGLAVVYLVGLALSPVNPTMARVVTRFFTQNDIAAVITLRYAILRSFLWSAAAVIVVALVFLVPVARWLNFRSPVVVLLALVTALLYLVVSIDRGVLQGLFRFREYNVNTILEAVIRALVVAVAARRFPNATFAMLAWTVGSIVAEAAVARSIRRMARGIELDPLIWSDFLELLRPMIVLTVSIAIFQNTDIFAVKRWLTADQAGVYGAASALARGFGVLFVPLYVLAGPLLTRLHEEAKSVFGATLGLVAAYIGLAAIPLTMVAFWSRPIIAILYGSAYLAGADVLGLLAGVTVVTYTGLMLSQAMITINRLQFLRGYLLLAIAQVIGLFFFHATFRAILTVLSVAQVSALLLVTLFFLVSQRRPAV